MDNIVSTVIVDYPHVQTLGIRSFQIFYFLFLASITSFIVNTLNSLIHSSTVSFNLMSNILRNSYPQHTEEI